MNTIAIFLTTFAADSKSYTILDDEGVSYSFADNDENKINEASYYEGIDAWAKAGNPITEIDMSNQ